MHESNIIQSRIVEFINEHHIFTLATSNDGIPWTSTCFYVFDAEAQQIIFTSDDHTRHSIEMTKNPIVSGAIALETKTIGKIRGVQFSGIITKLDGDKKKKAKRLYLKAFPYAILSTTTMWSLDLEKIKMTDNRLGFGKKLHWGKKMSTNDSSKQ